MMLRSIRIIPLAATSLWLLSLSLSGCSGPAVATGILPENVMAHPPELVALIVANPTSPLPDAMRNLGIPFHRIGPAEIADVEKEPYEIVIVDEGALDDEGVARHFNALIELARRTGLRLIILHQASDRIAELATTTRSPLRARSVPYDVATETPEPRHVYLNFPNVLTRADLDSLGRSASQLSHAADAVAVLAGNLDRPDESATLLQLPVSRGTLVYLAMPLSAGAAEGRIAEQRLLGNLLSIRARD